MYTRLMYMYMFWLKPQNWSFHVADLQRMAKKCTRMYNTHAESFVALLIINFCDALIANSVNNVIVT